MDNSICTYSRYARQIMLPQVGKDGQERLFASKVLVVGAGGLGSPVLYYLAAAGVGTLGVIDHDQVDISNLQRQILHWEKDVGEAKTKSAAEKIKAFNSDTAVQVYPLYLDLATARNIFPLYDLIIAAVDNPESRQVINEVCYLTGKPWIEGGVNGFTGLLTTFIPPAGPCYRCLHPEPLKKGDKIPAVLGTVPGIIGLLQAQEALKLILQVGEPLTGKLMVYDALQTRFDAIEIGPDPNCPVCSGHGHQ